VSAVRDLVILASMPWDSVEGPSIQLGTLRALLDREGIPVQTRAFNVDFVDRCLAAPLAEPMTVRRYTALAQQYAHTGLPEWAFAVPPYHDTSAHDARFLREVAAVVPPDLVQAVVDVRRHVVGPFLEACAADVLRARPRVLGLTLTHAQSVPSLALARAVKLRDPTVTILLGGAGCEGPMGAALHRAFPWIDLVVRGEAERALPRLLQGLREGRVEPVPGLCHRDAAGASVAVDPGPDLVPMDEVPLPDYRDYFARIEGAACLPQLRPALRLPYESARGCWWGERSHCTFCGISAATMPFRSKAPGRVVEELTVLAARHQVLDFAVVDYILDLRYLREVLPRLRDDGHDFRIFYEVKANLHREQVRLLRESGVHTLQPGIESLSTPILGLLRKGVTALQNVRLLKWCEEYGVRPIWNLITGIPREPADEYARMAALIPSLAHLEPPTLTELAVYRFSPYHTTPGPLGLEVTGPAAFYEVLYPAPPELRRDLAYFFDHRHLDGRDPRTYTGGVRDAVEAWRGGRERGRGSLRYRRGPGFLEIADDRPGLPPAHYALGEEEARIHLACEDGATVAEVVTALGPTTDEAAVQAFLDDLVAERLAFRENGRYLSLALPAEPRSGVGPGGPA
jgi:ribosomal peptide maturation radical SAM protein 1